MKEITQYFNFLNKFFFKKVGAFFISIENIKDSFVALLLLRRGKYSVSVLNSSFFLIVAAVIIIGPIVAQNTAFFAFYEALASEEKSVGFSPYEYDINTIISEKPRDKVIEYKVQEGETLDSVAKKFVDTDVNSIKWLNKLKGNKITKGQTLKIPPIVGIVHTVSPGETIYSIAKKYKVDPQNIVNYIYNDFVDQDTYQLAQGQLLYVPQGVEQNSSFSIGTSVTEGGGQNPVYAPIHAGDPGNTNFIWPTTGVITQYPAWYHMAYDIANRALPPVVAAESGTVIYSDCITTGYGCHIVIDNGGGFTTLYGHLSRRDVKVGDNVAKGQQIGIMGTTGRSTGPHLHFEVRLGGKTQNPSLYLKK